MIAISVNCVFEQSRNILNFEKKFKFHHVFDSFIMYCAFQIPVLCKVLCFPNSRKHPIAQ